MNWSTDNPLLQSLGYMPLHFSKAWLVKKALRQVLVHGHQAQGLAGIWPPKGSGPSPGTAVQREWPWPSVPPGWPPRCVHEFPACNQNSMRWNTDQHATAPTWSLCCWAPVALATARPSAADPWSQRANGWRSSPSESSGRYFHHQVGPVGVGVSTHGHQGIVHHQVHLPEGGVEQQVPRKSPLHGRHLLSMSQLASYRS